MPVSEVLCSPWAVVADVPARLRDTVTDLSDAELQSCLDRASEILWMLSGRRWLGGGCEETVTLRSQPPGTGTWPYHSSWGACGCWEWARRYGLALFNGSHIGPPRAVQLPRAPVTAITSVTIDGDSFADWELLRQGWVQRTDGLGWPVCTGTAEITYEFGEPPPVAGQFAAIELGVELGKDLLGLTECQLPQRVVNVTRQGVSMTAMDPSEFMEKGKVGLTSVDLWLSAVNPKATAQAAHVWSPDLPRTVRS